jgi:outer membrane protein assembly factor BamB
MIRALVAAAALLCSAAWAQPQAAGQAAGQTAGPLLRIEPGAHTSLIRKAVLDTRTQRLYTVSDDKTLRVWHLPAEEDDGDARLIDTWRVPAGAGHEGQLFALALSPDGSQVAVAGWTCWDVEQASCVYLFDARTGDLARRIRVAPHTITGMEWSPDGRYLAGLHGLGGLAVVELKSGRIVASDDQYRGKLMNLQFDRHGRLVTAALDGFVRYYRADFSLLARRAVRSGTNLGALRISPDGTLVAVGFLDRPVVELLTAEDMSPLRTIALPAARVGDSAALEWSEDSRSLYVSGESRGAAGATPILRYAVTRAGEPPRVIAGPQQRINDFARVGEGRMLFISEDPSIGWVDASDRVHVVGRSAQLDFSHARDALWVSPQADRVSFTRSRRAGDVVTYVVRDARLANGRLAAMAPRRVAPGLAVTVDRKQRRVSVNGRAVELDEAEVPRVHAVSHDGRSAYVGTEWALRALDAGGTLKWRANLPAVVWSLNAAADGKHVVALLSDGTVRWYQADTGMEVLALFQHVNREDWIAWTPAGYYASSPFGDKHVGWHIHRGLDMAPDFIRAVQLERVLYRPDLLKAALFGDAATALSSAPSDAPKAQSMIEPQRLETVAPPRIRLSIVGVDETRATARIEVRAERTSQRAPEIRDMAVYVNDIPVVSAGRGSVGWTERSKLKREFSVPLSQRWNDIRVETFTASSMGLANTTIQLPQTPTNAALGDLYVLAIGVNRFEHLGKSANLSFAAQDALAFAQALSQTQVSALSFRKRTMRVLSDQARDKPTRANILSALDFIADARANDTVVVFLASHGMADAAGDYYFVPSDARPEDVRDGTVVGNAASLLSWQIFFDALRTTAGRRVMVVDTCHAKGIAGRIEPTALIKRSASSNFALLLASGENERSQEYRPGGHGLFTYGLLSSLRDAGLRAGEPLTLDAWFNQAVPVVKKLRDPRGGPQTPQLLAPPALRGTVLAGT